MTSADAARRVPWLRYALLGVLFAAIWLAISLFSSAVGASAEEPDPNLPLDSAGAAVGAVSDMTAAVDQAVEPVVETVVEPVVEPVNAVVEPVVEAIPEPVEPFVEPVAEVAPEVTETVTDAANAAAKSGNTAVGIGGSEIAAAATAAAGSKPVGKVAHPVGQVADDTVEDLPVVGDVAPKGLVGKTVGPTADVADLTLDAVVGSIADLPTDGSGLLPRVPSIPLLPGGSVDPGLGLPGIPGLAGDSDAGAPSGSAVSGPFGDPVDFALDGSTSWSGDFHDPGVPADLSGAITPVGGSPTGGSAPGSPASGGGTGPGGAGAGGAGGASGTSDAAFAALGVDALASMVLRSVDDELPSSPVYDTDTTPD